MAAERSPGGAPRSGPLGRRRPGLRRGRLERRHADLRARRRPFRPAGPDRRGGPGGSFRAGHRRPERHRW
ncbi:hypothetical protein B5V46_02980 [Rhodovulum sp. MB263]|nr:hypothetical protein B5V46_02980 [Rhodovulum sp. MB263]